MKFETALNELESIVKKLESTNVELDDSIELFNKGINMSKECIDILKESKGKIELLTDEMNKISESFGYSDNE